MKNESSISSEILHVDPLDWAAIMEAKPNVLICGEPMFIDSFIGLLEGHCAAPIRRISHVAAAERTLPPWGSSEHRIN